MQLATDIQVRARDVVRPSSTRATPNALSSRRLSLPDYSGLLVPMKPRVKKPKKTHPYEFEKVKNAPVDTKKDKAIQFQFRPKREYLPGQRRSSLPTNHGAGNHNLNKLSRRSLPLVIPTRQLLENALSPFECQRQKDQKEEGALYSATRATERAAQTWQRTTIELAPSLGMVEKEKKKKKKMKSAEEAKEKMEPKPHRRESLMALLEKDASKYSTRLASFSIDDLKVSDSPKSKGSLASVVEANSPAHETSVEEGGYKLPYQFNPQALQEMQLQQVFKKQNAEKKRRSQLEKKERKIEAAKKPQHKEVLAENSTKSSSQPKEKSPKHSQRQEYLRVLKNALKEAEASREFALKPKIQSMKDVYCLPGRSTRRHSTLTTAGEVEIKMNQGGGRRSSMSDVAGGTADKDVFYDWALAAKKQKENAAEHPLRTTSTKWKYIKSDANAVRRSPDNKMEPLKPRKEFGNAKCLPKLEALLPMVSPKLRSVM